jgi:hypothetical protein
MKTGCRFVSDHGIYHDSQQTDSPFAQRTAADRNPLWNRLNIKWGRFRIKSYIGASPAFFAGRNHVSGGGGFCGFHNSACCAMIYFLGNT